MVAWRGAGGIDRRVRDHQVGQVAEWAAMIKVAYYMRDGLDWTPGSATTKDKYNMSLWQKMEYEWIENGVLHISVPFTWNLPNVQRRIKSTWMPVKVGGPAVELMPDYLKGAEIGHESPGVLQLINPLATRTTRGCPARCKFCGIGAGLIERGGFHELSDFVPGPILCDNNLLAASFGHLERVILMLRTFKWADFNQGLDAALVTQDIADLIATIGKPIIRMALDSQGEKEAWERAYECWRKAGTAKNSIRSYVLIGLNSDPADAWERCEWVEKHGALALPMWFHRLDALQENIVTEEQSNLGWSDYERRRIMQWFYQHKKAVK